MIEGDVPPARFAKEIFLQTGDGQNIGYRYRGVFHVGLTADDLAKRLLLEPGTYEVQFEDHQLLGTVVALDQE